MNVIKIGTRKSKLACVQAEAVAEYIRKNVEGGQAELVKVVTTGDKVLNKKLDEVGSKGMFVKDLDIALLNGDTDLSVHSLKDMPMEISPKLPVLGYSRREDARDVLVLPPGVSVYDGHLPIGSSSNRRISQLRKLYPGAGIKTVRGNVLTRLEKLDAGEYGALVLAAAGLKRLGLEHRISRYFSVEEMIPAAGQGILCVQGREGEDFRFLQGFFDPEAEICARAERAFMSYLNGGCSLPVGVYAEVFEEDSGKRQISIRGLYARECLGTAKTLCMTGKADAPEALGVRLARALKEIAG